MEFLYCPTMKTSSSTTASPTSPNQHITLSASQGWTSIYLFNRAHAFALFAFAIFVTCSIAGAHLSLALLTLCVVVDIVRGRKTERGSGRAGDGWKLGIEWPIIAFVVLGFISTATSEKPADSLRNMRHLLTILGAYAVAHSLRRHPQWRRSLLWTFIVSATVFSLFGIGEFLFGVSSKVQSTQGTTMTWGAMGVMFIAVTLQVAWSARVRRHRWHARVQIVPQVFAMLLSFVRGAYVGFAASLFYLMRRYWSNRRLLMTRILPVMLMLILIAAVFSPATVRQRVAAIFDLQTGSTQVRLVQWRHAMTIAADNPFFGVGWRDLAPVLRQYAAPDPNIPEGVTHDVFSIGHFHSNYVTLLACFGVTGLAAFLWLMAAVWRSLGAAAMFATEDGRVIVEATRAAMVGFLVAGVFDWTFGDAEVVTMFWFVIGMGLGQPNSGNSAALPTIAVADDGK
jgi:O-antigen ligase